MKFNNHSEYEGLHAFLSPSKYHWINDTEDKIAVRYSNHQAAQRGVELHEFASMAIKHRIRLDRLKGAINQFVNDAIGFNMETEQLLFYSEYCFGTADAISFRNGLLRIFDYKSGTTKAYFHQLDVYAAIFCLEYDQSPYDISIEERIYQGFGYSINIPDPDKIQDIMDKIVNFDKVIRQLDNQ